MFGIIVHHILLTTHTVLAVGAGGYVDLGVGSRGATWR